jgi:hypothetical protein
MSAPALVGNALVLHSLCYSIAPLPPGNFPVSVGFQKTHCALCAPKLIACVVTLTPQAP